MPIARVASDPFASLMALVDEVAITTSTAQVQGSSDIMRASHWWYLVLNR